MVKSILVTLIFLACSLGIYAAGFYEKQTGKGYYQYHTPKEDEKRLPDNETLMSMPAPAFQQLVTDTLNHALTVRNLDTYGDYARIQQLAFQRAEEFASLQVMYAQLHPVEDENVRNRDLYDRELTSIIRGYLKNNSSEYGFIYFYSPSCSYCAQQTPLLQSFQERHGWEIEAIDITQKPGLAERFEITVTPSLRMVDRDKNILPISNGLITLPELEERAYRFIRYLKGETSEVDFDNMR